MPLGMIDAMCNDHTASILRVQQRRLVMSEDCVLSAVYHDVVRRDLVLYQQRCSVLSEVSMKGFKKPLYFDTHAPGQSAEPWSGRFMEAFNYCFVWQSSLFRADVFLTSCHCMHFPY